MIYRQSNFLFQNQKQIKTNKNSLLLHSIFSKTDNINLREVLFGKTKQKNEKSKCFTIFLPKKIKPHTILSHYNTNFRAIIKKYFVDNQYYRIKMKKKSKKAC